MPTNQTENYQLSQWVKSDQVQMGDFNADNAKIDAALGALTGTVEEHAETLAGHTATIAKPGNCAVWTGNYTGNGTTSVTITCPHPPVYALVKEQANGRRLEFFRGGPPAIITSGMATIYSVPSWSRNAITWREREGRESFAEYILNQSGSEYAVLVLMDVSR